MTDCCSKSCHSETRRLSRLETGQITKTRSRIGSTPPRHFMVRYRERSPENSNGQIRFKDFFFQKTSTYIVSAKPIATPAAVRRCSHDHELELPIATEIEVEQIPIPVIVQVPVPEIKEEPRPAAAEPIQQQKAEPEMYQAGADENGIPYFVRVADASRFNHKQQIPPNMPPSSYYPLPSAHVYPYNIPGYPPLGTWPNWLQGTSYGQQPSMPPPQYHTGSYPYPPPGPAPAMQGMQGWWQPK